MARPEKLGKYQITDTLGEGAMGVVYKGFDPDIRRVVALKTIRRQFDDGSGMLEVIAARFRNEAQAAGRLAHPNIVAVYDYGEDGDTAFIAMEFVEGANLSHFLGRRVRFTDEDVQSVICQLLDGLDHAHEQGVWHRDVKPANLIMTHTGRLKIADFGIARIESAGLTRANSMIGTPSHMAPEQFLGTPIDRRVDVYGAGVVLFQMLTGRAPFTGDTESLMYRVVHEAAPVPSEVDPGPPRPSGYDGIVAKALAKDREKRFATAAAFKAAVLNQVGHEVSATLCSDTLGALQRHSAAPHDPVTRVMPRAGSTAGTSVPGDWESSVLSQVEASLARHIGPLARVMVRRAARECTDLDALYSRLAQQVTDPAARSAFLSQSSLAGHGPGSMGASGSAGSIGLGGTAVARGVTDSLRAAAERLLAQHLGPIARVVAKKAAEQTGERELFGARLAEAITDAAKRKKFLDDFNRL
ncbi:MAG: serine/threonine protein kinase [Ideonella sp.]|nr:serine/threonine protein kinase [Ideonella sp.]MBL0150150.1 serine/threonine protein kinase [Ideonella sp.]